MDGTTNTKATEKIVRECYEPNTEKIARECYERYAASYAETGGASLPAWDNLDKAITSRWCEALAPLADIREEVVSLRAFQAREDNAVRTLNVLDFAVRQVQSTLPDAAAVTNLPPCFTLALEKLRAVLALVDQHRFPLNWAAQVRRPEVAQCEVLAAALRCHAAALPNHVLETAAAFVEATTWAARNLSDDEIEPVLEAFRDGIRVAQGAPLGKLAGKEPEKPQAVSAEACDEIARQCYPRELQTLPAGKESTP